MSEEARKKMIALSDEERTEHMEMSLHWVCAVIEESNMDVDATPVKELLSALFQLLHDQKEVV